MLCLRGNTRTSIIWNLVRSSRGQSVYLAPPSGSLSTTCFSLSSLHSSRCHNISSTSSPHPCRLISTSCPLRSRHELTKEHLFDSEGNELPLLRFLNLMEERNKNVQYVDSPEVCIIFYLGYFDYWLLPEAVNICCFLKL